MKETTTIRIMALLTLMLSGRAMTLAFLGRVGGNGAGDPPSAWLMPLVGDAVIGLSAFAALLLLLRGRSAAAWLGILLWNALAIWDALAAYLVSLSNPWPEFFMLQIFGSSMFFAAALMHLAIVVLAFRPAVMARFSVNHYASAAVQ